MSKTVFWVSLVLVFVVVVVWVLGVRFPKFDLQDKNKVVLQTSLAINFDAAGSSGPYVFEPTDAFKRRYEAILLKLFPNREITQLMVRFVNNGQQVYGDYWEGNKMFAGFTPKISESALVVEIYLSPDLKKNGWDDQMILDHGIFTIDRSLLMAKYLHQGFRSEYSGVDDDAKSLRAEFPEVSFILKNSL